MSLSTVQQLVQRLSRLQLLTAKQLQELSGLTSRFPTPELLAEQIVQRGWMTPWQKGKLLTGQEEQLLLGSYVLMAPLGQGGMGEVFQARHQRLGRIVALKVIRKERLQSPNAVKRFYLEMQAVARLSHPNIVHAYDADESRDTLFFTMELINGIDLARLVSQSGPLPVAKACNYIRQAAMGLQHAHEQGLIHRDVKPQNLLLCRQTGTVKLLDLGLARLEPSLHDSTTLESLTATGMVMGTVDYIAPEQCRDSHQVDSRADLYSLGCAGYFLLAGRAPFAGHSATEKLFKHRLEEPESLEVVRPEVPSSVGNVIRKLMAKDPGDRWSSASEAAAALAEVEGTLSGTPLSLTSDPGQNRSPARDPETETTLPFEDLAPPTEEPEEWLGRWKEQIQLQRRLTLAIGGAVLLAIVGLIVVVNSESKVTPFSTEGVKPVPGAPRDSDPALAELERLRERARDRAQDRGELRKALIHFRAMHYQNRKASIGAARLLRDLPGPLDGLEPDQQEKKEWHPDEVIAIVGDERARAWAPVSNLSVTPDGKQFVSSGSGAICVWDQKTGQLDQVLGRRPDRIRWAVCSRSTDSKAEPFVVTVAEADHEIQIHDLSSQRLRKKAAVSGSLVCADVSTDDEWLVAGGGDQDGPLLLLWHWKQQPTPVQLSTRGTVQAVAFHPAKHEIAVCTTAMRVERWSIQDGRAKITAELADLESVPSAVAYSPNGRTVAIGFANGDIRLWNPEAEKPTPMTTLGRHEAIVHSLVFTPDGKELISGSEDRKVRIWDVETAKPSGTVALPYQIHSVICVEEGRTLIVGSSDHQIRKVDLRSRKEIPPPSSHPVLSDATFLRNELQLGLGGAGVRSITELPAQKWESLGGNASHGPFELACSLSGEWLISLSQGHAEAFDLRTKSPVPIPVQARNAFSSGAVSASGQWVALGHRDSSLDLHDREKGSTRTLDKPSAGGWCTIEFSHGGNLLAAGLQSPGGNGVHLWGVPSARKGPIIPVVGASVECLAFSQNDQLLAVGKNQGDVMIWSLKQRGKLGDIQCVENGSVRSVAFSPDATRMATADSQGRIALWEGPTFYRGRLRWETYLPGGCDQLQFAQDSRHLLCRGANGAVYLFRIANPDAKP